MRARFHRFLLLLLMLALPLQGFASASMRGCTLSDPAPEPEVTAVGMMADCHETEPSDHHPRAQHDCKHCAACALGAALPVPVAGTAAIAPAPSRYAAQPDSVFSGFVPDGPERPPRPILA